MIPVRRVRVVIVRVPEDQTSAARPRSRYVDLLPCVDPRIRELIHGLQTEVRGERAQSARVDPPRSTFALPRRPR